MKTLGIDLSADPKKTAACLIDWDTARVTMLDRPTPDEALIAAMADVDRTAIDVPLGWPDGFVKALATHHVGAGWPPASSPPPHDREPLRFRRTDRVAREAGSAPLSVSTDRLGVAAMRGARLQHLLAEAGTPVDRSGATGPLVEVYPAAALRAWGLAATGYKRKENLPALGQLRSALLPRCGTLSASAESCLADCDDDELDAFVCAVMARAAVLDLTTGPEADDLETARREGWIHLPTTDIESIVRQ